MGYGVVTEGCGTGAVVGDGQTPFQGTLEPSGQIMATGADATVSVTIDPLSASSLDSGDCDRTVPTATDPSASFTISTKKPALTKVFFA
jgi:hypothetical protein